MAYVVSGTHEPAIGKTFHNVRVKMDEIQAEILKTEGKTKEIKMASKEVFARERVAVDKHYVLRDKMQEIDGYIDKIEVKIEYAKERLFVAERRFEENIKMSQTLQNNRVDVPEFDEKMDNVKHRVSVVVENTVNGNRKIDVLQAKIKIAERRELTARTRLAHCEEILRAKDQLKTTQALSYKPKTDDEYDEELTNLRSRLINAVQKFQTKEADQASLERKELDLEAKLVQTKKKILDLKQTQNELKGSRM